MAIGAQVTLAVRSGAASQSACPVVVTSLVSGNAVISGSWGAATFNVTMTGYGSPVAGYAGNVSITGLQPFTRYNYTATQGALSQSGSFMTAPAATDDFAIFFAGCDCNTVHNPVASGGHITGFWDMVRIHALNAAAGNALPVAGVFFVDDLGYVDGCKADDTAGTGLVISDLTYGTIRNGTVRDYFIAHMTNMGMLQNTSNPYIAWGRDEDRVWCWKNLNIFPQWGDHEFFNDIGFDIPTASASSPTNSLASAATLFANGKTAWDALWKPLQPAVFNAGNSNGWGVTYGCVNLIAPDSVTNGNGTWNRSTVGVGSGEPTVLYGTAQIDDILAFIEAGSAQFNLFGMDNSIRYLNATPSVYLSGAQHPLWHHLLPEYQRLFTATTGTQQSLMRNPKSNGVLGSTVLLHGDYHHSMAVKYSKAAYSGNHAENFWSFYLGTISGSTNFVQDSLDVGQSYNDTTLMYDSGWQQGEHNYAGMRIDVYGSKSTREIVVSILNMDGSVAYARKMRQGFGNETMDSEWEPTRIAIGGTNV